MLTLVPLLCLALYTWSFQYYGDESDIDEFEQ